MTKTVSMQCQKSYKMDTMPKLCTIIGVCSAAWTKF